MGFKSRGVLAKSLELSILQQLGRTIQLMNIDRSDEKCMANARLILEKRLFQARKCISTLRFT